MKRRMHRGKRIKQKESRQWLFVFVSVYLLFLLYLLLFLSFFFKPELGNWTQLTFSTFEKLTWFDEIPTKILQSS